MKTKKTSVTLVLAAGLWLGLVVGCKTSTQRTREASNAMTVSAEDLYKAYESNEGDADKVYQGKTLMVTGRVGTTDVLARNPAVTVIDTRQKELVQCFGFAADQKEAVAKLKAGMTVSVKGKCMGKVVSAIPVLEDCVLQ